MTATLRALLFLQRICTLVCFVSFPLLQSRAAVGLQAAPPCRPINCTCLSLLIPVSHLPACFSLPVCPSLVLCHTLLLSLSQSLPAWVYPPLPHHTGLSALGLRTCIIPINSHRTGIIYSSLTDCYEKCLLRAEPGWTDNTPTHKTMQGCTHGPQLQISGLNMRWEG